MSVFSFLFFLLWPDASVSGFTSSQSSFLCGGNSDRWRQAMIARSEVEVDQLTTSLNTRDNLSTESSTVFNTNDSILEDFQFEAICERNGIYKGRLFTPEQCDELIRLSEFHTEDNPDWHGMTCKSIPGFLSTTNNIFDQLLNHHESGLQSIYKDMIKGSLRLESDSEPHLVKYSGKRLEAPLHKDNTHKSLTLNALLSKEDDFGGGGTYIQVLDKTIKLQQGQMLIHPGNLDHAGKEITFGVRRLLVSFLECEWEES